MVAADYFLKGELAGPLRFTINGAYVFPESTSGFRPYVGGGVFLGRALGETFTDLDLAAGVEYQQKFFLDGRLVLSDPSHFILSAGVRF